MLGSGVVVFDFTGPDASVTLFGRDLADDFSSALSKFNGRFYVVDRSYLAQAIERKRLAPSLSRTRIFDIGLLKLLERVALPDMWQDFQKR